MKKYILLLSFILLGMFALLSKYEDRAALRSLDFAVTTKVQTKIDRSSHLRFADIVGNLMEGATFFASPEFIVITTIIATGTLLYDGKKKRWNLKAMVIPIALTAIVLIELYGKSIVHHPSPPFSMIKNPTTVFANDYINEQFSYPSGHAARAIFLGIVMYAVFFIPHSLLLNKKLRIFAVVGLVAYVFLVSTSRVYLGHHWFSDVAGGLFLGASMGTLVLFALW